VCRESKVIRLLLRIHSGIILDLVCGFDSSVVEHVCAGFFLPSGWKTSVLYLSGTVVREGDVDLDSPKVHRPRGRPIGPGRV